MSTSTASCLYGITYNNVKLKVQQQENELSAISNSSPGEFCVAISSDPECDSQYPFTVALNTKNAHKLSSVPSTSSLSGHTDRHRLVALNVVFGTEIFFKLFGAQCQLFALVNISHSVAYILPLANHTNNNASPLQMLPKQPTLDHYLNLQNCTSPTHTRAMHALFDSLHFILTDTIYNGSDLKQIMLCEKHTIHLRFHDDTKQYNQVIVHENLFNRSPSADITFNDSHFEFLGFIRDAIGDGDDNACQAQLMRVWQTLTFVYNRLAGDRDNNNNDNNKDVDGDEDEDDDLHTPTRLNIYGPWFHAILPMNAKTISHLTYGKNCTHHEWFQMMQFVYSFVVHGKHAVARNTMHFYHAFNQALFRDFVDLNSIDSARAFFWLRLVMQFMGNNDTIKHVFADFDTFISHWNAFFVDNRDVYPTDDDNHGFHWIASHVFNQCLCAQIITDYVQATKHINNDEMTAALTPRTSVSESENGRKRKLECDDNTDLQSPERKKMKSMSDLNSADPGDDGGGIDIKLDNDDNDKGDDVTGAYRCRGVVLIVQGIPGLGKTTLGDALQTALQEHETVRQLFQQNKKVVTLEQDTFFDANKSAEWNKRNSGKLCQSAFEQLLRSDEYGIIVLLRNNSNPQQFAAYSRMATQHTFACIALYPHSLRKMTIADTSRSDEQRLLLMLVCLQSVLQRAQCPHTTHPSFGSLEISHQLALTVSFYTVFEAAESTSKKNCKVSEYEMSSNAVAWIESHGQTPLSGVERQSVCILRQHLQNVRRKPWLFDAHRLRQSLQLIATLQLNTVDYQTRRLSPKQIATNIVDILQSKEYENMSEVEIPPWLGVDRYNVLYFALFWNKKVTKQLNALIEQNVPSHVSALFDWKRVSFMNHHITLAHNSSLSDSAWNIYRRQMIDNPYHHVEITAICIKMSKIIAFVVEFKDDDASSVNLCLSQYLHITAVVAKNEKPQNSMFLVQRLMANQANADELMIKITPFQFRAELSAKFT